MAKYVGKIVRINNKTLRIREDGVHFVHIQWFNPVTKKFYCRVLTSLEHVLDANPNPSDGEPMIAGKSKKYKFYTINPRKYSQLINGKFQIIPLRKTRGFDLWGAYHQIRHLHISQLRGKVDASKQILK